MVGIAHFPTIPTNILRMLITSAVKRICPQPVCRIASAAVISPARQRATTRSKLSGKGRGLRPVYLPVSWQWQYPLAGAEGYIRAQALRPPRIR